MVVRMGLDLYKRKIPFKFFNLWADHEEFEGIISSIWHTQIEGSPLFQITQKLKMIKEKLKELNNKHFRHMSSKVASTRLELYDIQNRLALSLGDPVLRDLEKAALAKLITFSKAEESLLSQKSRVH